MREKINLILSLDDMLKLNYVTKKSYLRILQLFFSAIIIIISVLFMNLHNLVDYQYSKQDLEAKKGLIDLSNTTFEGTIFALDGEWEYYPQEEINPDEIINSKAHEYTIIPGTWSKSFLPQTYKGFATYRLKVKLPNLKNNRVGIRLSNVRFDYRLFINGELIFENGIYANGKFRNAAGVPRSSYFEVSGNELEIIMQVNNEYMNNPGISHSVLIGQEELIRNLSTFKNNTDIVLLGSLLNVAFYLLLYFYIFYREKVNVNTNYFLLAINTLFFALSTAGYREKLLFQFLNGFDSNILIKIHDLSKVGYYLTLYLLIFHIRKGIYPKFVLKSTLFYILFLSVIVLLLPLRIYGAYFDFFTFMFYFAYILFIYLEIKYILNTIKNKQKCKNSIYVLSLISLPALYSLAIIFYQSKNIIYDFLVSITIILFMFFMISRTFLDGMETMQRNHELEKDILRNEFAFLQSQIKPHFLFNTLSTVQSMIEFDVKKAHILLHNLSDYLRDAFDFDNKKHFTSISSELQHVKTYLAIEKERYVDRFSVEFEVDSSLYHLSILQYCIQPLVENALRHGILVRSSFGTIKVTILRNDNFIEVIIVDNGVGVDIEYIRLFLNGESRIRGVGIGNIHKRLVSLYGTGLIIESQMGSGTKIYFRYPITFQEGEL